MEFEDVLGVIEGKFRPYEKRFPAFRELPRRGVGHARVLGLLRRLQGGEAGSWKEGFVSGGVYHGEDEHVSFTARAYALSSQSNPLHPDVWPSLTKMEGEIIAMTAHMLHGNAQTRGAVTSGGTESILLAMKAYRDWAKATRGITSPELVMPVTAHAAFDKACAYFGIRPRLVPLGDDLAVNVEAVKEALSPNTVALVGSAPCFPYGVVDDLTALSEIARDRKVGCHADACLGGFVLPWARKLGYRVPRFDFELPGVTSISVDTHKYGYAPKGTSVVLYANSELLHHQYYVAKRWPGGIYFSPTMSGSRPGGLVAAAWATLLALGEDGYLRLSKKVLAAAHRIRDRTERIDGVRLLGRSLIVVAFSTAPQDVYDVMEKMSGKGWYLNGLQNPPGTHLAVTLRHSPERVGRRFVADLSAAMKEAAARPGEAGLAPIYGMANTMPEEFVAEFLESIVEWMYHGG